MQYTNLVRGEYDLKGSSAQRLRIGFAKCGEIYALSVRTLQSDFGSHCERMWRHRSGCRAGFADWPCISQRREHYYVSPGGCRHGTTPARFKPTSTRSDD